jgi:hypothetical protein
LAMRAADLGKGPIHTTRLALWLPKRHGAGNRNHATNDPTFFSKVLYRTNSSRTGWKMRRRHALRCIFIDGDLGEKGSAAAIGNDAVGERGRCYPTYS